MPQLPRQKINLSGIEYRATPIAAFGRLREMGPVVPARLMIVGNIWLITTYEAVQDALKDHQLFCRDSQNAGRNFWMLNAARLLGLGSLVENMINKDEPDHRRLRSLVEQAFFRQNIDEMRPTITRLVDEQLDQIETSLDANNRVDLIAELARPIPLTSICELLGLPQEDRPKFKRWFSSFADIQSLWGIVKIIPGIRKTMKYLRRQFDEVRESPRVGLVSALVAAEQSGDKLSDEELLAMVMLLLLAGHETTVHLISTSIWTMLSHPTVRAELTSDWSRIEPAVTEMLRYNSAAQFAKPRFVTRDTVFHGQPLKRGEMIMPVLASANYDPARFENPHEFQIDRPDNYHMTFGAGPHVCLGLKLARLETEIVLQQLFTRWPELRATLDAKDADWSKRMGMRSLKTLFVER